VFAGEGRLEELLDRKARLVADHDGHDLRVKSSFYSPQSKEPNPQQAEQGHAKMQQCV
jgi:hypothetical protein